MTPKKIIIHHSAADDSDSIEWGAIRRYHVGFLGWSDIGYHAGIEKVGSSYEALYGRPLDMAGAHALGHNKDSLGLCIVGDFSLDPPPGDQLLAAVLIVYQWARLFSIPLANVLRHSDVNATACPGAAFPWDKFIASLKTAGMK